jgi:hypothetical protein
MHTRDTAGQAWIVCVKSWAVMGDQVCSYFAVHGLHSV